MSEPTNASRVRKIEIIFKAFYNGNDPESDVTDILADVRHYCNKQSLCFGDLDSRSHHHYLEEVAEEKELFTAIKNLKTGKHYILNNEGTSSLREHEEVLESETKQVLLKKYPTAHIWL